VPHRPRILVLGGAGQPAGEVPAPAAPDADYVRSEDLAGALDLLNREPFDGVYTELANPDFREWVLNLAQARRVLDALPDGVAVLDAGMRVVWANRAFEAWCGCLSGGRELFESLGSPEASALRARALEAARSGRQTTVRAFSRDHRQFELHFSPVPDRNGTVIQLIVLGRDVTAVVNQQQKLAAIHQASRELAALSPEHLADMSVEDRIEVLKQDIRRLTHDLLHYDVIEIRLLDRPTGRLEPLLAEGMTPEASSRVLYARATENGVTGYVAATGKSYFCPDTAADPLYLEGASGARSSLTVPLLDQSQVIGTFNVESPQLNGFGEDDVQFLEIFSREIGSALRTLDLLQAEKRSTASRSVEAISREVALPVDGILNTATALLDRYVGHDPDMEDRLRKILAEARSLKQCIQKVGEDLAPAPAVTRPGERPCPALKGLRVLVADNDDRVRRSAHAILGRFGCVVETARDGKEALTMARLGVYDAILADIRLPDLPGYEVFHRLRQSQPAARVILMTAYGYDPSHSIVRARQEGLRHVLYKPFRVDQLIDALEKPDREPTHHRSETEPAQVKA
jgi:CheY-like chemotaxis protein/GAF domain-containing protein